MLRDDNMEFSPKSNYVKNKIKGHAFNDRNVTYIEILCHLESAILSPQPMTKEGKFSDPIEKKWWYFRDMRNSHRKEFVAIAKELNPGIFDKLDEIGEFEKVKEIEHKNREKEGLLEEKQQERELKKIWIKLGGVCDTKNKIR